MQKKGNCLKRLEQPWLRQFPALPRRQGRNSDSSFGRLQMPNGGGVVGLTKFWQIHNPSGKEGKNKVICDFLERS